MNKFFSNDLPDDEFSLDGEDNENINSDKWASAFDDEFRDQLREEYKEWASTKKDYSITESEVKELMMDDLTFLCNMDVKEHTLYKKWEEIQTKYKDTSVKKSSSFFGYEKAPSGEDLFPKLKKIKHNIWVPESIDDYQKLKPQLVITNENSNLNGIWNILRTFTHTQVNNTNIGRNLYFIVQDEITGKYLGVIALSSDFLDLTPRDNYIGWSRESKTGGMINHTAIGSTICPTQPLGFNYVGGKLMALLTLSDYVENSWNRVYDTKEYPSKLVGMTTTSLYSSFSQYQNLKYWNKRGHSNGSIKFTPSKQTMEKVGNYLQTHYPLKYWEWYVATRPSGMPLKRDFKQRSLAFLYKKLNVDKEYYETNHQRGIYFCSYYDNMKEFLKGEIEQKDLIRRKGFDNSVESLSELWKNKYALKRIKSLEKNDRLNISEFLFYDDLVTMTWKEAKEKYINNVGR